jgi:hypothetical protein
LQLGSINEIFLLKSKFVRSVKIPYSTIFQILIHF